MKPDSRIRRIYELFCFMSIIFYGFTLLILVFFNFEPRNITILIQSDLFIAVFLLLEFYLRIRDEKDKGDYIRDNWIDIVAIIPINFIIIILAGEISPIIFVIVKLVAIIKIFALYKFSRKISDEVLEFAEKTKLFYGLAIYLFVIIFGSAAVFYIERGVNPNLHTLGDGFWYIIQTITTVGYGDVVPVTSSGRLIGLVAMFTAIAFSSLLTATTTSALLEKFRKEREVTKEKSKETIGNLFKKLNSLENQINEIKSETDSLKEIKSEIQDLKKIIEKEK
ncbi:MAG: ion transporter [Methanobacterium sp.]|uniref:potassium channel family protein n=1 Tax=Methanobacterium sp. TaxID=2164 RepID=UPI003D64B422|nr:ion transporter [Methanobacterium sp.]